MPSDEVCTLVRFRGARVRVRYFDFDDEHYGRMWNFVSPKMDDVFLTNAEHKSVCRQIRCHAEQNRRRM